MAAGDDEVGVQVLGLELSRQPIWDGPTGLQTGPSFFQLPAGI